jgi:hypothetical protein
VLSSSGCSCGATSSLSDRALLTMSVITCLG